MKKNLSTVLLSALASFGITAGVYGGDPQEFTGAIVLTGSNTVLNGSAVIDIATPRSKQREVVKIEIDNRGGLAGTGTVTVAMINLGGAAETLATSGALAPGDTYVTYPVRTTTVTDTAYVVTNDVIVAVSPVRTIDVGRYLGRRLRLSVAQAARGSTNVVTNTYQYTVYVE